MYSFAPQAGPKPCKIRVNHKPPLETPMPPKPADDPVMTAKPASKAELKTLAGLLSRAMPGKGGRS